MNELDDHEAMDERISGYLAEELDRQVGCAGARFARMMHERRRRGRMIRAGGTLAAAACVAVFWAVQARTRPTAPAPDAGHGTQGLVVVSTDEPQPLELARGIGWRTLDDGTVFVRDELPMRQLRRQVFEYVQWYDPQHQAVIEMSEPREQVILVRMERY